MRDMIRGIRNFGIYLLPISLLATAGTLLMALLCYPAPSVAPATQPHTAPVAETPYGRTHAEALFAAMVADALRQIQKERETQARILMYPYENDAPSAERPAMLWAPPLFRKDADSSGPVLIRL
jgi:hypothetical protein